MRAAYLALALLIAGCGTSAREVPRAFDPTYRGTELRRPALTVWLETSPDFPARDRAELPGVYASILTEVFNAKAVSPIDLQIAGKDVERPAAIDRARSVGADHAVLVRVAVSRGTREYCRGAGAPVSANATVWVARAEVVRVQDGQARLVTSALEVSDVEPDCGRVRQHRRLSRDEVMSRSADTVVAAVLRP